MSLQLSNLVFICATGFILPFANSNKNGPDIIYAINAGGVEHVDINGIRYMNDSSTENIEYTQVQEETGNPPLINGVSYKDQVLYRTARYTKHTLFYYEMDIKEDGDYILVLKFCETIHTKLSQRVFNVVINGNTTVLQDFDIFAATGSYTAHDVLIPLTVSNATKLTVEFWKGVDSPTVNALYVMKGVLGDVPPLIRIPPDKILSAVNFGAGSFVDTYGITYTADSVYKLVYYKAYNGIIADVLENDELLYMTGRFEWYEMHLEAQIEKDGYYVAVFKFCEIYHPKASKRVINILVNDVPIISNLNVDVEVGFRTAYDAFFQFQIAGDTISDDYINVKLHADNTVRFTLEAVSDNLLINAFYILRGGLSHLPSKQVTYAKRVVYAINAGSYNGHADINGICYQSDPNLNHHFSDVRRLKIHDDTHTIVGVPDHDKVLFDSEIFAEHCIPYDISIKDGDYVLVLKFCENTFNKAEERLIDVLINNRYKIIRDLDVFNKTGGVDVAYDEKVEFKIVDGTFIHETETFQLDDKRTMRLSVCKGSAGYPFLNAFYVIEGHLDDVPSIYGGIATDQRSGTQETNSFAIRSDAPWNYYGRTEGIELTEQATSTPEPQTTGTKIESTVSVTTAVVTFDSEESNAEVNEDEGMRILFAMNAGGEKHIDVNGIEYSSDPLLLYEDKGFAFDLGRNHLVCGVSAEDQYLYQTQRSTYSFTTYFSYNIPFRLESSSKNGAYVLILKFCVLHQFLDQRIFDIAVDGCYLQKGLDIDLSIGNRVAHDVVLNFSFSNNRIACQDDYVSVERNFMQISFKTVRGFAILNAMCLIKGKLEDVPLKYYVNDEDKKGCVKMNAEEETSLKSSAHLPVSDLQRGFVDLVLLCCSNIMHHYMYSFVKV